MAARRPSKVGATREVLLSFLDAALPPTRGVALDAGCGRRSALARFRPRLAELVGIDVHRPPEPLPWLDRFTIGDVCRDAAAFPEESFDVCLSSFTVEHFADPPAAFRSILRWLRPGGSLVLTTVNRRHPLVALYLSLPSSFARRGQLLVKRNTADAHPLVGACNTPQQLRHTLELAGYRDVEIRTTNHLASAWSRHMPTHYLGLLGDWLASPFPSRRSTITARARKPA